jgi:hypothetical protein
MNPNDSFQARQNEARLRQQQNQSMLNRMRQQALSTMGFNAKNAEKVRAIQAMEPASQRLMAATGYVGSSIAKSAALGAIAIAGTVGRNYSQNVGLFTGNDAAQNRIDNFKSKLGFTTGRIATVAIATKTGAVFGPIGAAIGAATGLAINAINKAEEVRKLTFRIQERQAQSANDSQRLGRVIVSRGR